MFPTVSAPLRILMVTPRYFPDMGGVETHVSEVTRRLALAGADGGAGAEGCDIGFTTMPGRAF